MDGISLDAHGKQNLMPLTFTLGIFNSATRRHPKAWEPIYFHPNPSYMAVNLGKASPEENIENLPKGLELALELLKNSAQ